MGADLWIESIGFKAAGRPVIDPDWARRAFARCRRAINEIDASSLAAINERQPGSYESLNQYKQILNSDLSEVEAAVFNAGREAAKVEGGSGVVLLVTGGMSCGDSPTELFESMSRLVQARVMPDARQWPQWDYVSVMDFGDSRPQVATFRTLAEVLADAVALVEQEGELPDDFGEVSASSAAKHPDRYVQAIKSYFEAEARGGEATITVYHPDIGHVNAGDLDRVAKLVQTT